MKTIKETILEAFENSQERRYNLSKLAESLKNFYNEKANTNKLKQEFFEGFQHYVECMLQVASRDTHYERSMQFIAKFSSLFAEVNKDTEDIDDDEELNLYNFLLNFMIQPEYHSHSNKTIRFRICQLVHLMLAAVPRDAAMDADLMDSVARAMLDRIEDKIPVVRCQASKSLSRLQQPSLKSCPIISAYLVRMACDNNSQVRANVLSSISLTTKTLPEVLERTRDISEVVRKVAFQVIAQKVSIKALTSSQRLYLVKQGLLDQSESVRQIVKTSLFQAWLITTKGDIVEVLKKLDVVGAYETSSHFLKAIFETSDVKDLIQGFNLRNKKKLIDFENLTPETTMFWQQLCMHIKHNNEPLLEEFMPSVVDACNYMQEFFDSCIIPYKEKFEESQGSLSQSEEDDKIEKEYIMEQLFKIIMIMDLTDNTGRKLLIDFLKSVIVSLDVLCFPCLLTPVAENLISLHSTSPDRDVDEKTELIASLIASIRDPSSSSSNAGSQQLSPQQLTEQEIMEKKIQIAALSVELNEAQEELKEFISIKLFDKAGEIQKKIDQIQNKKCSIEEALTNPTVTSQSMELEEKSDVGTIIKCLKLFSVLASSLFVIKCKDTCHDKHPIHPTMLSLLDGLVIPCVLNNEVRKEAITALGIACLFSKDLASQHFLLFLQVSQVDNFEVRVVALDVMTDVIRRFGIKGLVATTTGDKEDSSHDEEDIGESLILKIISMLDDEEDEVRQSSASFLTKVLVSHRILSSAAVSRLILLWYDPSTQSDPTTFHMISDFLNVFPYMSREAHECVEGSILPILRVLFNAPVTSSLASVNINNVSELLVNLTSPSIIRKSKVEHICQHNTRWLDEGSAHDDLAVMICSEILSDIKSPHVGTLCKMLPMLELNPQQTTNLKDVSVLCENIIKDLKDKQALKTIKKFHLEVEQINKSEEIQIKVKTSPEMNEHQPFPVAEPSSGRRQSSRLRSKKN